MGILDAYRQKLHEEAGEDFDKGDKTAGADADEKLGAIHDHIKAIRELLEKHLINKDQADKDIKQVAKDEQDKEDEDKPE